MIDVPPSEERKKSKKQTVARSIAKMGLKYYDKGVLLTED